MKTITKKIAWYSNEYSDATAIKFVRISFDQGTTDLIKKAVSILKENPFDSITIDISASLHEEGEEEGSVIEEPQTEWRESSEILTIYRHSELIFYSAQSKYDGSDRIESEGIDLNEII